MIKIYEIATDKLDKIKNILEAPEKAVGELDVEIEKEAGRKGSKVEKAKEWQVNEFKRQGYILRDAKALEIDKKISYLYIDANEDFFERNEKVLVEAGAEVLKDKEYNEIKEKIDKLESGASQGMGLIFK